MSNNEISTPSTKTSAIDQHWISRGSCALTVALLLCFGVNAQQQDQQGTAEQTPQSQDQVQQPQDQSQSTPDQPASPNQGPAPADQPPPVDAKPLPKYAPQDENRPPYADDHRRQSRTNPDPGAQAPSPDQYDPEQDQDHGPYRPEAGDNQGPYRNPNNGPDGYPDAQQRNAPPPPARRLAPLAPLPSALTIPAGTILSVRVNEYLSSDRNQVGDRVTATLDQPLIVNGWVVARRGQTLVGQVEAVQKAGRVKGASQLGVEMTDLTLVDGQQRPILTELWKGTGGTSHGQDAATIGGTTALGAIIGSAADWGRGAAIGAGAGAAAGIGAVLLTRGRPTVIAPETLLSFRLVDPVTVDTTQSAQAFQPVDQRDYDGRDGRRPRLAGGSYGPVPNACGDGPCYGYPAYGYPVYPGYYYPGFVGFYGGYGWGPRFYGGFGRGFRR